MKFLKLNSFKIAVLFLVCFSGSAAHVPDHWAFQAPRAYAPLAVRDTAWPQTEIDFFILNKIEAADRAPAPAADARTLIRRIFYNLTGLPPTRKEVADFTADLAQDRKRAILRLVDELLARPSYGEHWGRHWLDIARYSDTKGYVYDREERRFVHAHTYRDWVVRAFNTDLPYDRFLLLQIAADQLVPPNSPDLAAMGFLTGGRRFLGVMHDIIDDRIDVVTRGAMALTVQCARCHDHKYDPISTKDYYSLYGVFHGSDDRLVPLSVSKDEELAKRRQKYAEMMAKRREEAAERLRARVGDYLTAQLELSNYPEEGFDQTFETGDIFPAAVRRWRDYLLTTRDGSHPIFGPWHRLAGLAKEEFAGAAASLTNVQLNPLVVAGFSTPPANMREVAERYGKIFAEAEKTPGAPGAEELRSFLREPQSPAVVPDIGIASNDGFFPTSQIEELWKLFSDVDRRMIDLGAPAALIATERETEPNPRVFKRGSPSQLGESVPRQFLEVLAGPRRNAFKHGNGRIDLAREIASPKNPLTARVMVNRIWQQHFGSGLVRTPSDFGLRAQPPTHPELLDWLALRFVAEGWSVKAMHRLIVASAVYQTAGAPEISEDPDNRSLAHFPSRRLSFEQLRDSMLAASGELDERMGGRAIGLQGEKNKRRTVYAEIDRQFLPGVLRTFDFANPDIHVPVRHETTVPQQALFFLNGTFSASQARQLAAGVDGNSPADGVQQLYFRTFQRPASPDEVSSALRFVTTARTEEQPPPPPPPPVYWQYGTGEYDEAAHRLKSFTALPYFTGTAWQGDESLPGGATGWAQLSADGGHPGNTRAMACVRRWVAPRDATVEITGKITHEPEAGDGVRAWVISSRHGELKSATIHKTKIAMEVKMVEIKAGDTLDFIVDIRDTLDSDQFLWTPRINAVEQSWDAKADFAGPAAASPKFLTAWEQYAQVLLLSNEFAFID